MAALRAVLICHSCASAGGSEARMSWRWVNALAAEGVELLVIRNGADPTSAAGVGDAPEGVEILDVRAPRIPRRFVSIPIYTAIDYWIWQVKARRVVKKRLRQRHADLIHHFSWGSLNYGSMMVGLDAPLVMGPIGGGTKFPTEYLSVLAATGRYETLRNRMVDGVRWNPFARGTVKNAAVLIASNPETAALIRSFPCHPSGAEITVMMDDGVIEAEICSRPVPQGNDAVLRVLWTSRMMEFKALEMSLDALEMAAKEVPIQLTIMGDGPDRARHDHRLADLVERDLVQDLGWVDQATMDRSFASHHVLLYNSLRDNGSAPLHEATKWGLPAVVLDHQGPGLIAQDSWAVKVPLSNPADTVKDLADALIHLAQNRSDRERMGEAALKAAHSNVWRERAIRLIQIYQSLS